MLGLPTSPSTPQSSRWGSLESTPNPNYCFPNYCLACTFKVVSSTVEALTLLSTQPKHLNLTFLIPSNKAVAALAASRNLTVDQIVNQVANNITSAELTVASLTLTRPYVLSNTPDLTNLPTRAARRTIVERNVNGVVTLQTPLARANIVIGPIYFGPSIVYVIDSVLYF